MGSADVKALARTRGIVLVAALSVLQSTFRLVFFYMGMTGAELLEVKVASSTQQMINIMFLLIGVFRLITAYGLYQMKSWGYWGTILLSVVIIVFDIWGLTIQLTAAMGLVLPIIFIAYLLRCARAGLFGGVFSFNKYGFGERLVFRGIRKDLERQGVGTGKPYDFRDWEEIREWTKELVAKINTLGWFREYLTVATIYRKFDN